MDNAQFLGQCVKKFAGVELVDMSCILKDIIIKYHTNGDNIQADQSENSTISEDRALHDLKVYCKKYLKNNKSGFTVDMARSTLLREAYDFTILRNSIRNSEPVTPGVEPPEVYPETNVSAAFGAFIKLTNAPSAVKPNDSRVDIGKSRLTASSEKLDTSEEENEVIQTCRYCGDSIDDNGISCELCKEFLKNFVPTVNHLELLFCIKSPTCREVEPLKETSKLPSSWCLACKLFHYVKLGYRVTATQKRKNAILKYLTMSRLNQPELVHWARGRRCVEYFAHKLAAIVSIEQPVRKADFAEISFFLDRLWCRASSRRVISNEGVLTTDSVEPMDVDRSDGDSQCQACPCQFCHEEIGNIYAITLGPGGACGRTELSVCGVCVSRCRASAARVADRFADKACDALSTWYDAFAKATLAHSVPPLCECSDVGSKCDLCFLGEGIKLLHSTLSSAENLDDTKDQLSRGDVVALGSPLFFACCKSLLGSKSKDLGLYSNIISEDSEDAKDATCLLCHAVPPTELFKLDNGTVVCEDCILGYKALLVLLKKEFGQGTSSDLALLARLVSLPCYPESHHAPDVLPLWSVCLSCHARRCLRLLHPLEPCLELPSWLKRRARLAFYSHGSNDETTITTTDIDPTVFLVKRQHKGLDHYCIVKEDYGLRSRLIEKAQTLPVPEALVLPAVAEDPSFSLISDSTSAESSLISESEIDSADEEQENKEKEEVKEDEGKKELESPVSGNRDRRVRRLTAKYAEALREQTRRHNKRDRDSAALPSLGSPVSEDIKDDGEDAENHQHVPVTRASSRRRKVASPPVRPPKRPRIDSASPVTIVEGKRQPKINPKLQGDYATLSRQGRWESSGVACDDDAKSDLSSSTVCVTGGGRRGQQRRSQGPGRGGPRVKVVDRMPPPGTQSHNPMSVIKHAARLAAVGAQTQDGANPFAAASAAEAYFSDTSSADGGNRLRPDCGNCAACRGMVHPCGRCHNCRQQAHYGSGGSNAKGLPCIETICHRRRHLTTARGEGARVKVPLNFSARAHEKSRKVNRQVLPAPGPAPQPSLFDTVPGLQEQLMNGLYTSTANSAAVACKSSVPLSNTAAAAATTSSIISASSSTEPSASTGAAVDSKLEVFVDAPVRSIRGGDLGMYFAPHDPLEDASSLPPIAPVEGEVIDSDIALRGGFPVVTTAAAAPPKDICYLCGSAGVDLRVCVSCAEPSHSFCDKHQTHSKDTAEFLCSNCISCAVCEQPAVELCCVKCSQGFHPGCIPGYASAMSRDRSRWVCPYCTSCIYCLARPLDGELAEFRGRDDAVARTDPDDPAPAMVPWSREVNKCAECATAEAQGHVCPECERPYLAETVEMLSCDSCHRWLHRACAKFTYDQYELIARAPPSQIRPFPIYCNPCKHNILSHSSSHKARHVDSDEKLRSLVKKSLTDRMNALMDVCNASSLDQVPGPSSRVTEPLSKLDDFLPPEEPTSQEDEELERERGAPSIPQTDGPVDSPLRESMEQDDIMVMSPSSVTSSSAKGKKRERGITYSWLALPTLIPPPFPAAWLVDNLNTERWITPKNLAYVILARLTAKMDRTPRTSYEFFQLRRLKMWLSNTIQSLFPWMDAVYTTREVRALLRLCHGSVSSVVDFLHSLSDLELYELACPHVVALMGKTRVRMIFQSYQSGSPQVLGFYRECIREVREHITFYHPDFGKCNFQFRDAVESFVKLRAKNVGCMDPKAQTDAHFEPLVDYSGEVAIGNFQKELFFKFQRLLHHLNHRALSKALNENDTLFYFACKSSMARLHETFASQMVPLLEQRLTVDLDESDSDVLNESDDGKIRALPIEVIENEEKELLSCSEELRRCLLCARKTDCSIEDRLIYIGSDTWVHVNCALWSKEVFEEDSGQLTGLSAALRRGGQTRCCDCGQLGATMTCSNTGACSEVVHFPCALRRRKPTFNRPIFTADRSFFCSKNCYLTAKKARIAEAVRMMRLKKLRRFYMHEEAGLLEKEEEIKKDERDVEVLIAENEITEEEVGSICSQVDSDMESPELKEMLVCRRVFVPSDCFLVSMQGVTMENTDSASTSAATTTNSTNNNGGSETDSSLNGDLQQPRQPVLSLAISPNTLDFALHRLPSTAFVITIGALRIDRLGYIAEASDALCVRDRPNYLCPIGYRARRTYWSVTDPNAREHYVLSISQVQKPVQSQSAGLAPTQPSSILAENLKKSLQCLGGGVAEGCGGGGGYASRNIMAHSSVSSLHTAYERAVVPEKSTVTSSLQSPALPTSPGGRIIPTTCTARNSSVTAAFDPHPNNPVGLPLIRFMYQQGPHSSKPILKARPSPLKNTTPTSSSSAKKTLGGPSTSSSLLLVNSAMAGDGNAGGQKSTPIFVAKPVKTAVTATPTAPVTPVPPPLQSTKMTRLICTASSAEATSTTTTALMPRVVKVEASIKPSMPHRTIVMASSSSRPVAVYAVTPSAGQNQVIHPPGRTVERIVMPQASALPQQHPINFVHYMTSPRGGNTSLATTTTPRLTKPPVVIRQSSAAATSLHTYKLANTGAVAVPAKQVCSSGGGGSNISIARVGSFGRGVTTSSCPVITRVASVRSPPLTPTSTTVLQLTSKMDAVLKSDIPQQITIVRASTSSSTDKAGRTRELSDEPQQPQQQINQLDGIDDSVEGGTPRRIGNTAGRRTKRKWMADQERRQELNACVMKARRVAEGRVYQKEALLYASSFVLRFSTTPWGQEVETPTKAWREVVGAVARMREMQGIDKPIARRINGWAQFGLSHRHIVFLLEQLPEAHTCFRYRFRYHRYRVDQLRELYTSPVPVLEGAARLKPYNWRAKREEEAAALLEDGVTSGKLARDPLAFLMCKANRAPQCCLPLDLPAGDLADNHHGDVGAVSGGEVSSAGGGGGGGGGDAAGVTGAVVATAACIDAARQAASIAAARFNFSPRQHARVVEAAVTEATADILEEAEDAAGGRARSQFSLTYQLRNLARSREARWRRVGVYPSRIHKRGLFALCSFRPDEVICEYTGEVIRDIICDRREAAYRANGVDCYFFRIDVDRVIDATYAGNYARFINHSCQPNCDAKTVRVGDNWHIVIIAKRRILPGEELTYDYHFPKEQEKVPCFCGRIGCRKYLN